MNTIIIVTIFIFVGEMDPPESEFSYSVNLKTLNGIELLGVTNKTTLTYQSIFNTLVKDGYTINCQDSEMKHIFFKHNNVLIYDFNTTITFNEDSKSVNLNLFHNPNKINTQPSPNVIETDPIQPPPPPQDLPPANTIQILLHTFNSTVKTLSVNPNMTVSQFKQIIQDTEKICTRDLMLIYRCSQLRDERTLTSYQLSDLCSIHLMLRLRGGMYHETSGRDGNYKPLTSSHFYIE